MALRPFTQAWVDAFRDAIESSESYREAAQGWLWPLALVMEPAPELGFPRAVGILLELERGRCHGARVVVGDDVDAPFVIRGEYAVWKEIMLGELDPVAAVMHRRLRLDGSLTTMIRHARAAKELTACAAAVPTLFPDETPAP